MKTLQSSSMWSSQQYIENGLAIGRSSSLLDAAVDQIEAVIESNPYPPAILTLGHLAHRTGVPHASLRRYVSRRYEPYRSFYIRKQSGGRRLISIPEPDLFTAQRWLAKHVLRAVPTHRASFAFAPGSSIVQCAAKHTGAAWLIKLDIKQFFPSISEIQVYRVFRELGYQRLISFELARISTFAPQASPRYMLKNWQNHHTKGVPAYGFRGQGYLPQGAPTSPMLSNLVMRALDEAIARISRDAGVRYSRYADDMTFSTKKVSFGRAASKNLIREVKCCLMRSGFRLNMQKATIVPPGARKVVLGLLVDGTQPKLTREFRSNLRQHLYYLEKFGPVAHAQAREFDTVWGMKRHIRGLLDFAKIVDEKYAMELLDQFQRINWP